MKGFINSAYKSDIGVYKLSYSDYMWNRVT